MSKKFGIKFWLPLLMVVITDQITKKLATYYLKPLQPVNICCDGFIRFTLLFNKGGAFSLLSHKPTLFFIISSTAFIILIIIYLKTQHSSNLYIISSAMIFGGAIGNIIDRIIYGKVIDFIDVDIPDIIIPKLHIFLYRWPSFNIADSSITVGGIILFFWLYIKDKKQKRNNNK